MIELNYIREYILNVISESELRHEDNCIKKVGTLGDLSLKVKDEDVEKIGHDVSNLSVAILQKLGRKRLYKAEKYIEKNGPIL